MRNLSLTARLTLIFSLGFTALLVVLGGLIGMAFDRHFEEQDRETLARKLLLTQRVLELVTSADDVDRFSARLGELFIGRQEHAIQVRTAGGEVLFDASEVEFPTDWTGAVQSGNEEHHFEWRADGTLYRGLAAPVRAGIPDSEPYLVAVAVNTHHQQAFMQRLKHTLWKAVAAAALVTALIGWCAANRGLAPLRAIRARVAGVTARKLDQRLDIECVPAELAGLVDTLNEMLERLDEAFRRLSNFSSDLAHELRTPINNLMTQTQVSLSRRRDAAEYREILESNAEELERLGRMIADMLFLAKAENGLSVANCETVDLAGEVRDLFEFYEALAEEKGVRLRLEGEGVLQGDKLMLRRALSNLLSNALRHASAGKEVVVTIAAGKDRVAVHVDNQGDTIPAEEQARLFERFYRGDPSRCHLTGEGTGLGLAIVKAIVRAHGGDISLYSAIGRTRFSMEFSGR